MAATARFSKEFYSRDAIAEAIADWEEVGAFSLGEDDGADNGHFVVALESLVSPDGGDSAEVLGEFTNYVLGVEIGKRR